MISTPLSKNEDILQGGFGSAIQQESQMKSSTPVADPIQRLKKHVNNQTDPMSSSMIFSYNSNTMQNINNLEEDLEDDENEGVNIEERNEKLAQIVQRINLMKDEKRARDLTMNLRSRMLKNLDSRKFTLLNDRSVHYDQKHYKEQIEAAELKNQATDLILKQQKQSQLDQHKQQSIEEIEQVNQGKEKGEKYENESTYVINKQKRNSTKNNEVFFRQQSQVTNKSNISSQRRESQYNHNTIYTKYMNTISSYARAFKIHLITLTHAIPIVYPSSSVKLIWDFINMMVIMINLFLVPVTVIFEFSYSSILSRWILYLMAYILVLDIIINLNTGFFKKGQVVKNHYDIFINYCAHNIFTDMFAVAPFVMSLFTEIGMHLDSDDSVYSNSWLASNSMKVLKLFFFLKTKAFNQIIKKIEERFNLSHSVANLLQLAKLLFTIILINHLFACLWVFVARKEEEADFEKTWMNYVHIEEASWESQYISAFYFTTVTMITVGYGDILPKNNLEMVLCVVTMMIACGVFGYSLNEVGQIFSSFFAVDNQIKAKISTMQRFMSKKGINSNLQYQIREYLEYYWRESAEMNQDQEQAIIEQLSDFLRNKLLFEANKIALKDSPIFKGNFSKDVIEQTVPLIKEIKFSPESFICQTNVQDDQAIYFIEHGSVEIILNSKSKHPESLLTLNRGDSFGAHTFFTGLPRINNIRSKEFTTVLKIRRADFINLVVNYVEDHESFCAIRDQITYLNDYTKIGEKCHSCSSCRHEVNTCQYLHFLPNKERVIRFYNEEQDIQNPERSSFPRRIYQSSSYNFKQSLSIFSQVFTRALQFQEDYEALLDQLDEGKEEDYSPSMFTSMNSIDDHLNLEDSSEKIINPANVRSQKNIEPARAQETEGNDVFFDHLNIKEDSFRVKLVDVLEESDDTDNIDLQIKQERLMRRQSSSQLQDGLFDKRNEAHMRNLEGNNNHEKEEQMVISDEMKGMQSPKKRSTLRGATKRIVNVNKLSSQISSKTKNLPKTPGELTNSYQNKMMFLKKNTISRSSKIHQTKITSPQLNKNYFKSQQNNNGEQNQYEDILKKLQVLIVNQQSQAEQQYVGNNYLSANLESDRLDIFLHFDKMKAFVKYNPRFNYSSIISRFNQILDSKRIKKTPNKKAEKNNKTNKNQQLQQKGGNLSTKKDTIISQINENTNRRISKFFSPSPSQFQQVQQIQTKTRRSTLESQGDLMIVNALGPNQDKIKEKNNSDSFSINLREFTTARNDLMQNNLTANQESQNNLFKNGVQNQSHLQMLYLSSPLHTKEEGVLSESKLIVFPQNDENLDYEDRLTSKKLPSTSERNYFEEVLNSPSFQISPNFTQIRQSNLPFRQIQDN